MATTTIVQTEVPNYDEWRKGFDGNEQKRADAGIFIQGVYRDVDNGNKVTVISKAESIEAAKNFFQSSAWSAAMERSGKSAHVMILETV
jgi:hypothetical protein